MEEKKIFIKKVASLSKGEAGVIIIEAMHNLAANIEGKNQSRKIFVYTQLQRLNLSEMDFSALPSQI